MDTTIQDKGLERIGNYLHEKWDQGVIFRRYPLEIQDGDGEDRMISLNFKTGAEMYRRVIRPEIVRLAAQQGLTFRKSKKKIPTGTKGIRSFRLAFYAEYKYEVMSLLSTQKNIKYKTKHIAQEYTY